MHIACAEEIVHRLIPALQKLRNALNDKAQAWKAIVKIGRTHTQDATPLTLGQEFSGYTQQVENGIERVEQTLPKLMQLAQGGTAVGTGLNAPVGFAEAVADRIAAITGLPFTSAPNKFEALAAHDAMVFSHGAINTVAASLFKIANDIRFLGSGPRSGLGELALPENEPGSSIMPGKVNPVIVESLTMVVARVIGNDATVAFGQTGSFLELNVMMPVTSAALLESIVLLSASARNFRIRLVEGLKATDRGPKLVEQGLMLATALAPEIGYDAAAAMAKEGFKTGRTIRELALEKGIAPDRLDELLDPAKMTEPGLGGGAGGG
jgi:fumarate hydratase class II